MKKLLSKLKSDKGSIDKVIVTLLLVIVAVAGIVGLEKWTSDQRSDLQNTSTNKISNVIQE